MKVTKTTKLASLLFFASLFLTGCMQRDAAGQPTGLIYEYMVLPTQYAMDWLATMTGSYGLSLVIISILVRLVLMPIMFNQSKKMLVQQEKMAKLKPYLDDIKERADKAPTAEERAMIQQEQMELYKLNGVSMVGGMGCSTMIIQIMVFNALYNAILLSEPITNSSFLGISLGQSNIIITVLAGISYFAQSYLSQLVMPEDQKKQMQTMLYMSPLLIVMMTWSAPAGTGLYFLIGGIFAVIQTWIQNQYIRPRVKAQIDAELDGKEVILPERRGSSTKKQARPVTPQQQMTYAAKRNTGKQNRKK